MTLMGATFSFSFLSKISTNIIVQHLSKIDSKLKGKIEAMYKKSLFFVARQTISNANFTLVSILYIGAFALSAVYSMKVYPNLPQELGGIKPKEVCITFKKK